MNNNTTTMKDVHTEHCCLKHGCQYADDDCTVVVGKLTQSYSCEHCDSAEAEALALVMEFGSMLAEKDEWDMDDNFETTEALYSLYCEITGHGDPS